jgi:hypothetical protein
MEWEAIGKILGKDAVALRRQHSRIRAKVDGR